MSALFAVPPKSPENDAKMLKRTKHSQAVTIVTCVAATIALTVLIVLTLWSVTGGTRAVLAALVGPVFLLLIAWLALLYMETIYFLVPVRYASCDLNDQCDPEMLEKIGGERAKLPGQNGVAGMLLCFTARSALGDYAGAEQILSRAREKQPRGVMLRALMLGDEAELLYSSGDYDGFEKRLDELEKMLPQVMNEASRAEFAETTAINRDVLKLARGETDGVADRLEARLKDCVSHFRECTIKDNIARCARLSGDAQKEKEALAFIAGTAPKLKLGRDAQARLQQLQ